MGRIKYLGHAYEKYIKSYSSKIIRIDDEIMKGYVSQLLVMEVNQPFIVNLMDKKICLYNNGYSEYGFLPDGENWMVWGLYDDSLKIIEWYFDITRKNSVDENGNPYCDDLYLDIVLMENGKIIILDEDELLEALDNKNISKNEFKMAYETKDKIIDNKIVDVKYMEKIYKNIFNYYKIKL